MLFVCLIKIFDSLGLMGVETGNDNLGGLAYPFLPDEWQWQIVSRPLDDATDALDGAVPVDPPTRAGSTPALRWVKDDKVLDLFIPGGRPARKDDRRCARGFPGTHSTPS